MKKIAVVGCGYVGSAMVELFKNHYDVGVYDPKFENVDHATRSSSQKILHTRDAVNSCDAVVVCVPTPMLDDGSCDISIVDACMAWIDVPLILLKSTVMPGTTEALNEKYGRHIVFSPEYCGESSYWTPYAFHTDIKETPFFVFGGQQEYTSRMVDLFMPVTGPTKRYVQCDSRTAEVAKYMENSFYATKITICHEFKLMCDALGVDYNTAREIWLLDPRLNPMHTAVFDKQGNPFSGKCLPKDINAFVRASQTAGYQPNLLEEVIASNNRIGKLRSK